MKMKNRYITTLTLILGVFVLLSCEDNVRVKTLDFPNDVTFDIEGDLNFDVPAFTYVVPSATYTAKAYKDGEVTFNVKENSDGTHSGFALSSKNYRSYPWCTSKPHGGNPDLATLKAAVDTSIYSVYTKYPNQLKTYSVVRVDGDDAFFTLDKARVVEHVLVANTTYNYMLLTYGSRYSSNLNPDTQLYEELDGEELAVIGNPNIPDPSSSKYGVWYLPDPYGFGSDYDFRSLAGQQIIEKMARATEAADAARSLNKSIEEIEADSTAAYESTVKGYFKITAQGYLAGQPTASVDYYLAVFEGVAPAPHDTWNIIQPDWAKWDLTPLGTVDKVVFYLDSSDKDENGKMRTPPYFCLDGIRLK